MRVADARRYVRLHGRSNGCAQYFQLSRREGSGVVALTSAWALRSTSVSTRGHSSSTRCGPAARTSTSTPRTLRSPDTVRAKPSTPVSTRSRSLPTRRSVAALDGRTETATGARVNVRRRDGTTFPAKLDLSVVPRNDGGRYIVGLLEHVEAGERAAARTTGCATSVRCPRTRSCRGSPTSCGRR